MRATGFDAENLGIEHVGNPRERMPIGSVKMGEGPRDALKGETARDHRIVADVFGVVVIDEVKSVHLPINAEDGEREAEANKHARLIAAAEIHLCSLENHA